MKKKKIAVIDMDDLRSTFWGAGQARATREAFKRLADKYEITIYTAKYPGWKDYSEDGLTYIHVGIDHPSSRLTNALFILTIPWLVTKIKADVIFENFNAPISASASPLFTRTPVVGIPTMFNAIEFTKKYHLPFHWFEWLFLQAYSYMVAYSDIDSKKMKMINNRLHYRIIPQGVGEEFFKIPHLKSKHILFLGRFDVWQKGIDLLIESYAKISNQIDYPLVIAGKGPDEEKIKKLITQHHLEGKVLVQGPAYGVQKEKLISEAICVAFPSRHDELSLWALEALGSGMPIVAFDLPEGRWMTEDAVLKSDCFDTHAYAQNLLDVCKPKKNVTMRKAARQLASSYTWEHVSTLYDRYITDIITKRI